MNSEIESTLTFLHLCSPLHVKEYKEMQMWGYTCYDQIFVNISSSSKSQGVTEIKMSFARSHNIT